MIPWRWFNSLAKGASLLYLLEVASQSVAAWRLNDATGLAGRLRVLLLVLRAGVAIVLALLLLFPLLAPVDVVLELYPDLPFGRLVPNERVLEQLLGVRSVVVVLH